MYAVVGYRWKHTPACKHEITVRPHLTEYIYEMVFESQLSHKIVKLLTTVSNQNNRLTILWGGCLCTTIELILLILCEMRPCACAVVGYRWKHTPACKKEMTVRP